MAIEATITSIAPSVASAAAAATPGTARTREVSGFVDSLGRLVLAAESSGKEANAGIAGMLAGSTDVHDAMIALQQADLALQLTVQVRNKLVQAYQEIMRMPI